MSQAHSNIRSAIVQAYLAANTGLPTALPNKGFKRPSGKVPWAELIVLPGTVVPQTLGDAGEDYHNGVLQVTLRYPPDEGEGDLLLVVDLLSTHFRAGQRSAYNGIEVVFRSASRTGGRIENGWWTVVVSVSWYAMAPRS